MEPHTPGLSKVEYLTIFGTFVYGYVAAQFFMGWGAMVYRRKKLTLSAEHLGWTILTFMLLIDIWWGSWLKGYNIAQNKLLFYLSMVSPLIFYLISTLLFPPFNLTENTNLNRYFERVRVPNYVLFVVLCFSFYANDAYLHEDAPLSDYISTTAAIALAATGLIFPSRWVHRLVLIAGCTVLFAHLIMINTFAKEEARIGDFTLTEYLIIFTAFIYGAAINNFFSGWASMFYNRGLIKMDVFYLGWTIVLFLLLMDVWWGQWAWESLVSRNVGTFILALVPPMSVYFLSVLAFPPFHEMQLQDQKIYFQEIRRGIYTLIAVLLATNFGLHFLSKGFVFGLTNIVRITAVGAAAGGIMMNTRSVDRALLITAFAMVIFHAIFH